MAKKKNNLYVVIDNKSKKVSEYKTWDECKPHVLHKDVTYKGFNDSERSLADEFIKQNQLSIDETKLDTTKDDVLYAYVDGSRFCLNTNECIAYSYGVCLVKNNEIIEKIYKSFNDSGNRMFQIMGELKGALRAVSYAIENNYKEMYLIYDYIGVEKFGLGLWNSKESMIIAYHNKMKEFLRKIDIKFVKVKSHVSEKTTVNIYNDVADELANLALNDIKELYKNSKTCSFTGHRPNAYIFKYDENNSICKELKKKLQSEIEKLINDKKVIRFYSGLALGWDIWSAEIVLELKNKYPQIELIAVVPTEVPNEKWIYSSQKRYIDILKRCNNVISVGDSYSKENLLKRNDILIESADFILTCFNCKNNNYSGTGYTLSNALKKEKEIIDIYDIKYFEN